MGSALNVASRGAKLARLAESEGFPGGADLLGAAIVASICPAICMNERCSYTTEMEPDQDAGYCEECRTNSPVSALILAGLI